MASPLSPIVSLALSMHAQPGVYAVLLGSGVSTGAGIPTGWGILRELVSRAAAAADPDHQDAGRLAREDPERWWSEFGDGELGYSTLLARLAPLPATRQGLLEAFFEPNQEEREEGLKQPSQAHRAIAELVQRGAVRVIITTNFDRLMEQALDEVGASPKVISRPEAVNGMAPLAHSKATIIKLHGDYKDLGSRNTSEELSCYPVEWERLLAQIFDEYGLIISGWSAEWDNALVCAVEQSPNRRYPLYWDARSCKGENAQQLLKNRDGISIPADNADDFFSELLASVDALDRLEIPPLSTAMAVARLKKYVLDPTRRIDLHDLVMHAIDEVVETIASQPSSLSGEQQYECLQEVYERHFQSMDQLAALLIAGVWHDREGAHDRLWLDLLQKLLDTGTASCESLGESLEMARRVPAYIALSVAGITAILRGREGLLIQLATKVESRKKHNPNECEPAAQALHYLNLTNDAWINHLPCCASEKVRYPYPISHFFAVKLRDYFADVISEDNEFTRVYQGFEYRLGLIQESIRKYDDMRAISGEYVTRWNNSKGIPHVETEFLRKLGRAQDTAWQNFFGEPKDLEEVLIAHRNIMKKYIVFRF